MSRDNEGDKVTIGAILIIAVLIFAISYGFYNGYWQRWNEARDQEYTVVNEVKHFPSEGMLELDFESTANTIDIIGSTTGVETLNIFDFGAIEVGNYNQVIQVTPPEQANGKWIFDVGPNISPDDVIINYLSEGKEVSDYGINTHRKRTRP